MRFRIDSFKSYFFFFLGGGGRGREGEDREGSTSMS